MYKDWDSFEGHCITLHTIVTIGLSWEYFVQFNPNSVSYCALWRFSFQCVKSSYRGVPVVGILHGVGPGIGWDLRVLKYMQTSFRSIIYAKQGDRVVLFINKPHETDLHRMEGRLIQVGNAGDYKGWNHRPEPNILCPWAPIWSTWVPM